MNLIEATMNALQGKLEVKNLNEMKPFEAAKYKGKEWGVFGNKSNAWLVFGTEKEMKAKADELNRQEGNYEPDDEELFAEARNPENDEINSKISKTLNGSTKYMDDLDNAGLGVKVNDKGKADSIYNKAEDENNKNAKQPNEYVSVRTMNKQDLKKSNTDTDYYNYLTKNKVRPEVTDTGAFAPTNVFRNSNSFEKTISGSDTTYRQEDRNGVSKAIPKRYKTGRKNYDYNPDVFPKKDYTGVASYEPLDNQELQDFKYNKSKVDDGGWLKQGLDKAKAEYDQAKAEYDKVNNQVKNVRDRIAKSKSNRKEEARSHKEDNERVAPRTVKNARGNDVETREMVDVSNPAVGNKSYHNEKGSQYWGTTEAEYASKRNKTGQKNEYGYDVYLAPFKNTGDWTMKADRMEPATATAMYQYQKEQGELLKPDLKRYRDKEKRARNPENKEYWKNAADNIQRNIDDYDTKAKEILDKEKERIANKKTESAENVDAKNIEAIQDIIKKSGITNERTVDLMSKDILKDLKRNYTKGCKDEYGNYYGTVITDAFRKKVQQITGKMPDLKIGENRKIKEESIGRNRKIRKKVESSNAPVDGQAYWAYVLGYDFLQDYFKNSGEPECDLTFEKAWEIADDFMHSEEFQDTSKSGYDALVDYLKNRKLIECELTENKEIKTEEKTYTIQANTDKYITYNDIDDLMFIADTLVDEIADYVGNKFDVVEMLENEGVNVTDEESDKAYKIIHQLYDFEGNSEDEHIFYIPYNDDDDIKFLIDALIDIFLQFGDNEELLNIIDKHYHIENFNESKKIESVTTKQSNMKLASVTSNPNDSGYRIVKSNNDEVNICTGSNMLKLLYTIADLMGYGVLSKEAEELSDIPEEIKSELTENSDILYTIENYKLSTLTKFNDTNMTAEDLANYLNS